MKRLELGRLSADGEFGLRISAPGHDVGSPGARLLFDTNTPLVCALMRSSFQVGYTRAVFTTSPPYGLPGAVFTVFQSQSRWDFPTPLAFAPMLQIGLSTAVNGQAFNYDGNRAMPNTNTTMRYESHTTHCIVTISEGQPGDVDYSSNPIHRITILNVARPL